MRTAERVSRGPAQEAGGLRGAAPRPRAADAMRAGIGNQAMQRLLQMRAIQAKLTVNEPRDRFEQEADRVADHVMRMPDPGAGQPPRIQRMCTHCQEESERRTSTPPIQRMCAHCQKERQAHDAAAPHSRRACAHREEEVQRKASSSTPLPADALGIPPGGGRPLPEPARAFFEPRFGASLEHVRIHSDARADVSARAVNARAYTIGSNIVFRRGEYQPGTSGGRALLAHEVAHTFQQTSGHTAIQRTIGDGHDLTAPRFAGDVELEAVYDNERVLGSGSSGPAVRTLQQALVDAGFVLPRFGVDGDFGRETERAVRAFQRASGLSGAQLDGVVGPTTMGWLDQRFSAGPTPGGLTPGATAGCAGFRIFGVDMVSLDRSTGQPLRDLEFANTVFNQCCVRFTFAGGGSEDPLRTRALLGGDTELSNPGVHCGTPSAEETRLFAGASADFGLSSSIRVFYVASISSSQRAYSNPALCGPAAAAGTTGMVVVTNRADHRSLAHELGHILFNTGIHSADTKNLMHQTRGATGEQITPAQCATI